MQFKNGIQTSKQYHNKVTVTLIQNKASEKYHCIIPASPSLHDLHTMDRK